MEKQRSLLLIYIMEKNKIMNIPEHGYERGIFVLQKLETAGYEGYFVGGCIRDHLLNRTKETDVDFDITTNANPEEVKNIFKEFKVIETGIKHGTVTVMIFDTPVEITTFRSERGYSDNRHPDEVNFVRHIEDDLARRDFTVNAIACDAEGNLIDLFGGIADIETKTIRAVGEPKQRFEEDALRIMRALRFSAVLGFQLDEATERAAFQCRELLRNVSVERFFTEFQKLICGANAPDVVRRYIDIIGVMIPELSAMKGFKQNNPYHKYDVLEHCIRAMEAIKTIPENHKYMKLAALLHDVGKPLTYSEDEKGIGHFYSHPSAGSKVANNLLKRLKVDGFTIERVTTIIKYHDLIFERDARILKKWMNKFTPQVLIEILEIKKADNFATGNMSKELHDKFDDVQDIIYGILDEEQCFSMMDLAVTGKDLIGLGMIPGPEMGRILKELLDDVINEKLSNNRELLIKEALEKAGMADES